MIRLTSDETAHQPPERPKDEARLLLASKSPRRRRLLSWLGVPFSATAVDTPENLDTPLAADPPALARSLAAEKAEAALAEGLGEGLTVLCFDTIVVLDGGVLGKPADAAEGWRMLRALSGRTHQVVTGVAIVPPGRTMRTLAITTDVTMKPLTDCQIEAWMATGEYLGCAGAYNIEAQVAEVTEDDCYQNVAGMPLCHLFAELALDAENTADSPRPTAPISECDSALCRSCRLGPSLLGGR